MMTFVKFGDFLKAAHAEGAAAVIGGQGGAPSAGMHLTHTGAVGFDGVRHSRSEYVDGGSAAAGALYGARRSGEGEAQRAESFLGWPGEIGECDGRNSRDPAPGTDYRSRWASRLLGSRVGRNGQWCGTSTTLGAAAAIMKAGVKPRRTIRFVLFTGEEQGSSARLPT